MNKISKIYIPYWYHVKAKNGQINIKLLYICIHIIDYGFLCHIRSAKD